MDVDVSGYIDEDELFDYMVENMNKDASAAEYMVTFGPLNLDKLMGFEEFTDVQNAVKDWDTLRIWNVLNILDA